MKSSKNEGKVLDETGQNEAPERNAAAAPSGPFVIVIGNEKGGAGKTTVSMHLIAALLNAGKRVGAIDLDIRQRSLSNYIEHRSHWAARRDIAMPDQIILPASNGETIIERQRGEADAFVTAMAQLRTRNDFIVIDCPGSDSYFSRLGHAAADMLITPMNESFVDFDLLAKLDPETLRIEGPSIYAENVWSCRKARAQADGGSIDWVVMRNRTSHIHAKNRQRLEGALDELSKRLGFRQVPGFSERVVYREMFPAGLTLLDLTDEETGPGLTMSHVAARAELAAMLAALQLPDLSLDAIDRSA
jgi:chromosome partitioning protein